MCGALVALHQLVANIREGSEMFPTAFRLAETIHVTIQTGASDVGCRLEDPSAHFAVVGVDCGRSVGRVGLVVGELATEAGPIVDVVRAGDPLDLALAGPRADLLVAATLLRKFALAAGLGHGVREAGRNDGVQVGSFAVWVLHNVAEHLWHASRRLVVGQEVLEDHRTVPAARGESRLALVDGHLNASSNHRHHPGVESAEGSLLVAGQELRFVAIVEIIVASQIVGQLELVTKANGPAQVIVASHRVNCCFGQLVSHHGLDLINPVCWATHCLTTCDMGQANSIPSTAESAAPRSRLIKYSRPNVLHYSRPISAGPIFEGAPPWRVTHRRRGGSALPLLLVSCSTA